MATATPATQKAYDVAWAEHPGITTRTSYVIDRSGKVVMVHDDLDFSQHVAKTLAAVKALKSGISRRCRRTPNSAGFENDLDPRISAGFISVGGRELGFRQLEDRPRQHDPGIAAGASDGVNRPCR